MTTEASGSASGMQLAIPTASPTTSIVGTTPVAKTIDTMTAITQVLEYALTPHNFKKWIK